MSAYIMRSYRGLISIPRILLIIRENILNELILTNLWSKRVEKNAHIIANVNLYRAGFNYPEFGLTILISSALQKAN